MSSQHDLDLLRDAEPFWVQDCRRCQRALEAARALARAGASEQEVNDFLLSQPRADSSQEG